MLQSGEGKTNGHVEQWMTHKHMYGNRITFQMKFFKKKDNKCMRQFKFMKEKKKHEDQI